MALPWLEAAVTEGAVDRLALRPSVAVRRRHGGWQLGPEVARAAELLASVIGQDIEETDDSQLPSAARSGSARSLLD
jgi:hypothetical protein